MADFCLKYGLERCRVMADMSFFQRLSVRSCNNVMLSLQYVFAFAVLCSDFTSCCYIFLRT